MGMARREAVYGLAFNLAISLAVAAVVNPDGSVWASRLAQDGTTVWSLQAAAAAHAPWLKMLGPATAAELPLASLVDVGFEWVGLGASPSVRVELYREPVHASNFLQVLTHATRLNATQPFFRWRVEIPPARIVNGFFRLRAVSTRDTSVTAVSPGAFRIVCLSNCTDSL
jgi:hypothetical protein